MKASYIEGLSIVIPTYNRYNSLCRLLNSIFQEDISSVYEIIIVDNNSDYNIYEILKLYSSNKIRIVRNVFNVRMSTNMMNTFLHCKTKWMWLISDDDFISKGALGHITKIIKVNPNSCYLKFSTEGIGDFGIEKKHKANNLEELIDYYHDDNINRTGNLVFVSNGIFNIHNLYPFLGYGFEYAYTYIGYLIPVFMSLSHKDNSVTFSEKIIINYSHPGDKFWSYKKVVLGLSTLYHIELPIRKKYFKKLLKITNPVSYLSMFNFLLKEGEKNYTTFALLYNSSYRFYLDFFDKIIYYFLSLCLLFPKISKILKKIIEKLWLKS